MASEIFADKFFPYDENHKRIPLPLFVSTIKAGFVSPADDYEDKKLDMNELCINHPAARPARPPALVLVALIPTITGGVTARSIHW